MLSLFKLQGTSLNLSIRRRKISQQILLTWILKTSAYSRAMIAILAKKKPLNHPQWRLSVQTHKYLGVP